MPTSPGLTEIMIGSVIFILVFALLLRWILAISHMTRHTKYQTELLMRIAKNTGTTSEELKDIIKGWGQSD